MNHGFHYFPDESHYRAQDLAAWLPELTDLGAGWLTLTGSLARAIPEAFIRGLLDAAIEPIVHIAASPIRLIAPAILRPLLETYAGWGVRYVVVYGEPNTRKSWTPSDWGRTALVERFLDLAVPILEMEAEAGLEPVFPPLTPGGDYWDTAFLDAALASLLRRKRSGLLAGMVLGAHLYTGNRPPDWGAGGLARWPASQPYLTPPGSQDQRGFRAFEWYGEIARARLGRPLPIITLAGGARLGDANDPNYPPMDDARHAGCNLGLAMALANGELPDELLNVNFWLLASEPATPHTAHAWYRPDGATLKAVAALKKWAAGAPKAKSPVPGIPEPSALNPAREAPEAAPSKSFYHYLLLPTFEWGVSEWHWSVVRDYVQKFRPAVGFEPREAQLAQCVTIVGNEQGVSSDTENALRRAGCEVERIAGRDGDETRARLDALAERGQRFQRG